MWTTYFWLAVAERALKSFCQGLAAVLIAEGTGLIDTAWAGVLSVAGMTMLISALTSIASGAATGGSASLTPTPPAEPSPDPTTSQPKNRLP